MKRRVFTVELEVPLSEAVTVALGVPAARARQLLEAGAVYVDGRRARTEGLVTRGARVVVVLEEGGLEVAAALPLAGALSVLFEDDDVLAVDKPPGVTAQPTPGRVGASLVDLATRHLGHPAGLVHRLDRETSGVTVFGKHAEATTRLAAAFRQGRAQKEYLAVTAPGLPPEGAIDLPLSRDPARPGRWRASRAANGLPALTHYTRLSDGPVSVVSLFPQTGRTHQLRAHLAALGHPIVGDRLYGGPPGPRCLLHARRLVIAGFAFEAPVPADLARWLSGDVPQATTR